MWSSIGIVVLIITSFIDYRRIRKYSKHVYVVTIILIGYTVLCMPSVNNLHEMLSLSGLSINVAYTGIIFFTISMAGFYDKYKWNNKINTMNGMLLGTFSLIMIAITNSTSCFIIYSINLILLVYMSKADKKVTSLHLLIEIIILLITKVGFNDIYGYINRWNDIEGSGYIYNQLKIMRNASVLIGRGSYYDMKNMPEIYGDYMFSSIMYNFGYVACIIVVIIVVALLTRVIKVAFSIKNNYGKSLVIGVMSIFTIQFVWNILLNMGFALYGVYMPFISYSSTDVIFNMVAVGMIINVYKGRSLSRVDLL